VDRDESGFLQRDGGRRRSGEVAGAVKMCISEPSPSPCHKIDWMQRG
jgi:hypothetical protein